MKIIANIASTVSELTGAPCDGQSVSGIDVTVFEGVIELSGYAGRDQIYINRIAIKEERAQLSSNISPSDRTNLFLMRLATLAFHEATHVIFRKV